MTNRILAKENEFAEAAFRAKKAGFDAWAPAAHGFLLNQFLTQFTIENRRVWGMRQERAWILAETYRACARGSEAIIPSG
jgi:2,4-dienoyl-CoA reductase-like NADH-dependent reductase (Old Yellow Enzyme family)